MTDWSLLKSLEELTRRDDPNFRQYQRRLLDEAALRRRLPHPRQRPGRLVLPIHRRPRRKKSSRRPPHRAQGAGFSIKTIATSNRSVTETAEPAFNPQDYEVGYRNGGGIAIAALALASTQNSAGDFPSSDYLRAAREAFAYLEKNNARLMNDGKENIVDDYCALMAATELFKATKDASYKSAADTRADNLLRRLTSAGGYSDYFRADDKDRPFFHAADAGLPIVALLNYKPIADEAAAGRVLAAVKMHLKFQLAITAEVPNPFGYARQLVQSKDGTRRASFFFPHDTETAPWWQGENARLASLAAAARLASREFPDDPAFQHNLRTFAADQLNWILGLNPYDTCMLHGAGHNNPAYMFFDSWQYTNAPGGICNGITAGYTDPHDIDFHLPFSVTGKDEDWRWGEQWLPHAAWYLYAVSLGN